MKSRTPLGPEPPAPSPSVSRKDIEAVYDFISTARAQPLRQSATSVLSLFATTSRKFDLASLLSVLLVERVLLPRPVHRIAALYALYAVYEALPFKDSPFIHVFLDYIPETSPTSYTSPIAPTPQESWLCLQLFQPVTNIDSLTPLEITAFDSSAVQDEIAKAPHLQRNLELALGIKQDYDADILNSASLRPSIYAVAEPDLHGDIVEPTLSEALEAAVALFCEYPDHQSQLLGFRPPFPQCLPPSMPLLDHELSWIHPAIQGPLIEWDPSIASDTTKRNEVRQHLLAGAETPLSISQQQHVASILQADPNLVLQCGVTTGNLVGLVEHNPSLAFEALKSLASVGHIDEFLEILINMGVSLQSMEVVNQLASSIELPSRFLQRYVSNCISTCELIADKYAQNRHVRLVCVFLQSLISNGIISPMDFVEIQPFCIQFSRIKEAAALFRLLKRGSDIPPAAKPWA
ncbi:uncharacterized protein BJ171DRAFT_511464 [Polychytrium aggregatum]|uniref:uncharacterized protein n=1 Tax=Polychytrium aggregatum TaxID=110093 RepID=UPI0022FE4999|nr:uncharacterized protein BJ171DRAFT_511464 [Polychytrium aggregatum]KAI9202987.1 hypothetical protein BJ171DRAFT_511464 [Polychytrium aggregatum]